jgi:hypothetical protein
MRILLTAISGDKKVASDFVSTRGMCFSFNREAEAGASAVVLPLMGWSGRVPAPLASNADDFKEHAHVEQKIWSDRRDRH